MEHLTFCDMASVEHSKQELNQKLIKGRETRIENLAENDISAANDVTRRRQQHQPQGMNEFYERVKANLKLLLEMFPHEISSAQQEQSQQNQEG
jgi:hypothetical protein